MSPKSRFKDMLAGAATGAPLIDIGTTSLTGIRAGAAPHLQAGTRVAHPIFATLPLDPINCMNLGSDFIRAGALFDPPVMEDEQVVDAYGVEWLWHQGSFSPLTHPLESADLGDIARYPRPQWQHQIQAAKSDLFNDSLVIADAPCPGLLDMCFMLRNTWQFIEDITENWRIASALLEWSLETIVRAYEYMLTSLPEPPDVIVYGDDLGYQDSMYLSPLDFRTYVRPRLKTLLSRLRHLTPAAICFHSCGAIRAILPDIADFGVELVNLDTNAKGMGIMDVRRALPASVVLHGSNDLGALGRAIANGDKAGVALLITELAQSAPVIAGPIDNISSKDELEAVVRGAAFIRHLSNDDFESLRRLGPVRSIIETAIEKTLSQALPALT